MIGRRLMRLVRGDLTVFEDLASDPRATVEAFVISAVSSAVGTFTTTGTAGALALGAVAGMVGLAGWTGVLWATGRGLGGHGSMMGILRAVGYTAPPFALSGVPVLGVAAVIGSVALQVVVVMRIHRVAVGRAILAVIVPWAALVVFGVTLQASQ